MLHKEPSFLSMRDQILNYLIGQFNLYSFRGHLMGLRGLAKEFLTTASRSERKKTNTRADDT